MNIFLFFLNKKEKICSNWIGFNESFEIYIEKGKKNLLEKLKQD